MTSPSETFKYYFNREKSSLQDALQHEHCDLQALDDALVNSAESPNTITESVIDAVAYLCAGIKQKIETESGALTRYTAEMLYGEVIAPYPMSGVIQFATEELIEPCILERGSTLRLYPKTSHDEISFETRADTMLFPLRLDKTKGLSTSRTKVNTYSFTVDTFFDCALTSQSPLRLTLAGQPSEIFSLYYSLLTSCTAELSTKKATYSLSLHPERYAEQMLAKDCQNPNSASLRLLKELVLNPLQFLAITLTPDETIQLEANESFNFELTFTMPLLPHMQQTLAESLFFNCIPIANSIKTPSTLVTFSHNHLTHRVMPDHPDHESLIIASVNQLSLYGDDGSCIICPEVFPFSLDKLDAPYSWTSQVANDGTMTLELISNTSRVDKSLNLVARAELTCCTKNIRAIATPRAYQWCDISLGETVGISEGQLLSPLRNANLALQGKLRHEIFVKLLLSQNLLESAALKERLLEWFVLFDAPRSLITEVDQCIRSIVVSKEVVRHPNYSQPFFVTRRCVDIQLAKQETNLGFVYLFTQILHQVLCAQCPLHHLLITQLKYDKEVIHHWEFAG